MQSERIASSPVCAIAEIFAITTVNLYRFGAVFSLLGGIVDDGFSKKGIAITDSRIRKKKGENIPRVYMCKSCK